MLTWVMLTSNGNMLALEANMLALEANIPPSPTRFNLFWRPSWTLNRVKNEVKINNRKPRILCKIHINRPLAHLRRAILRTIYIDLHPSYVDHPKMINIRRIKIDINGPEDSSRRQL